MPVLQPDVAEVAMAPAPTTILPQPPSPEVPTLVERIFSLSELTCAGLDVRFLDFADSVSALLSEPLHWLNPVKPRAPQSL